ncbi:MAG: hypothetical protein ACR2O6_12920 [Ilumatobacteraceae bacterium]
MFPFAVALIIVLGFGLVVYARESRPAADASAPTIDDHWHHSYGFYLCDTWFELDGDAEEQDSTGFLNDEFRRTGVHSHGDGLIHWHAFTSAATGRNATLGVFLDVYGVELTNTKLTFPESQRAGLPDGHDDGVYEEGETVCVIDGEEKDGSLKVVVWDNFSDTDGGTTFIADFNNIRLDQDGMAIAIAFVPDNTDVSLPPSAPELPTLAQSDSGQLTPDDLFGGTDSVPADSVPEDTAVDN